jgi:C1A family cysteine protease
MPENRFYGWVPDVPDHRDFLYSAPLPQLAALPPRIDLRPGCPKEVYDQGQLGSCTANALAGAIEFEQIKQGLKPFTPSRLFIYFNERAMEGTVKSDSGARIRDGIKSVGKIGACPEPDWPYDVLKFAVKPPDVPAYKDAPLGKAIQYQRVPQVLNQMKGCLASGYPFVFGFTVYASFESPEVAKTGVAPMPGPTEPSVGGHAVLAVGYDDATQRFVARNSWGPSWGMNGYFTLPYAYLTDSNLADDFWTIRLVAKAAAQLAAEQLTAATAVAAQ